MNEIEELIASYAKALPGKTVEVEAVVRKASAELAAGLPVDWAELEHVTHKLAGSSGTYGFIHLSVALRHLEEAVADGRLRTLPASAARAHLERCWTVISEQSLAAHERRQPGVSTDQLLAPLENHLAALLKNKEKAA